MWPAIGPASERAGPSSTPSVCSVAYRKPTYPRSWLVPYCVESYMASMPRATVMVQAGQVYYVSVPTFDKIRMPIFTEDLDELHTYKMDLRQILKEQPRALQYCRK